MAATSDKERPLDPQLRALFEAYRAELLRWNLQINLLSRREPEATADALIGQCLAAFELWWTGSGAGLVGPGGALRVFDLGSGGGLPAFVWLALLAGRGVAVEATLFEPRAKRAWFLERLTRLPGAPPYAVVAARWGQTAVPPAPSPLATTGAATPILFTLKALRLSEAIVLRGLDAVAPELQPAPGASVELVRFQPTRGVTAARLARELEIPAVGANFLVAGRPYGVAGCRLLAPARSEPGAAALLVSRHLRLEAAEPDRPKV